MATARRVETVSHEAMIAKIVNDSASTLPSGPATKGTPRCTSTPTHEAGDPHPEQRSRPTDADRRRDADDVARADRRSEGGGQRLEQT
jgi:hypothetical protein